MTQLFLAMNWYKKSLKFNPNDKKPDKNLNFCQNKIINEKRKAMWVSFYRIIRDDFIKNHFKDLKNAEDMIQKASILMSDSKYKLGLFLMIDGSSIGWGHLPSEAKASKLFNI